MSQKVNPLQLKIKHIGRRIGEVVCIQFLDFTVDRYFHWNLPMESVRTRLNRFVYALRRSTAVATVEVALSA